MDYSYSKLQDWLNNPAYRQLPDDNLLIYAKYGDNQNGGTCAWSFRENLNFMSRAWGNDMNTWGWISSEQNRNKITYIIPALCKAEDEIAALKAELAATKERLAVYEEKERVEQEELARRKAEEERMAAEEEVWMKMAAEQNKMEEEDKFSKRVMAFEELKGLF
jgi:hypothetical protein